MVIRIPYRFRPYLVGDFVRTRSDICGNCSKEHSLSRGSHSRIQYCLRMGVLPMQYEGLDDLRFIWVCTYRRRASGCASVVDFLLLHRDLRAVDFTPVLSRY